MVIKLTFILYTLSLLISCANVGENKLEDPMSKVGSDTIEMMEIHFFPSFLNPASLYLNRKNDVATFRIDTSSIEHHYGFPFREFSFALSEMERNTSLNKLWDGVFLKTFQPGPTGMRDGMAVEVFYSTNNKKESIELGNNYSQKIKSFWADKLDYLAQKTADSTIRSYIKEVKEYL